MHYLIKWRNKGVEENSWLTDIELHALGTESVELLAAFKEAQVEEPQVAGGTEAEPEDPDEFYVEALLDRRYSYRSSSLEYLIRWGGFGSEDDSWEPAEGLPADMRSEYDASHRGSGRAQRRRK